MGTLINNTYEALGVLLIKNEPPDFEAFHVFIFLIFILSS